MLCRDFLCVIVIDCKGKEMEKGTTINSILTVIIGFLFAEIVTLGVLVLCGVNLPGIFNKDSGQTDGGVGEFVTSVVGDSYNFEEEDEEECKHFPNYFYHMCIEKKAKLGNVKAQKSYLEGVVREEHMNEALKRIEEAKKLIKQGKIADVADNEIVDKAYQGEVLAQFEVGDLCSQFGAYEDAVKWYEMAANEGYAQAKVLLGEFYERGVGVSRNYKEALNWYIKAQEGCIQYDARNMCSVSDLARYRIGKMYEKGRGVPQDDVTALDWYIKAAKRCDDFDVTEMKSLVENKVHRVPMFRGSPFCGLISYTLGQMFENKKDYKKAIKWYTVASRYDDGFANYKLGVFYYEGNVVKKDIIKASEYLRAGGRGGDVCGFISKHPEIPHCGICDEAGVMCHYVVGYPRSPSLMSLDE